MVIMGGAGWGKSTLCAQRTPDPVFIQTEDGLSDIDTHAFPLARTLQEAWAPLMELSGSEEHDFKTVVIDSGDWLESLIHKAICESVNVESISDIDFGKGYAAACDKFAQYLQSVDSCVAKGMNAIFIVHASIQKFTPPDGESYDRYVPKLHMNSRGVGAGALLFEWADEVFYCTKEVFTKSVDEGFGNKRNVAVGGDKRLLYTTERPGCLAKNRLGLPGVIGLDEFEQIFTQGV